MLNEWCFNWIVSENHPSRHFLWIGFESRFDGVFVIYSSYEPALYSGLLYLTCAFINTISSCSSAILCVHFTFAWTSPREHNIPGDEVRGRRYAEPGKIEEFNPASTNINRYLERLEQYFVANGVPADSSDSHKRRATLISVIVSKPYDVLADLCSPVSLSAKTYVQLATILKNHFAPKTLVIAERYRFHNCSQREGESVATFAAISGLTSMKLYAIVLFAVFAVRKFKKSFQLKNTPSTGHLRLHLARKRPRKTSLVSLKTPRLW